MPLKFRVFSWIGALLMGVLSNINTVETVWAQIADDVVVLPQQRPKARYVGDVFRDCSNCPEVVIVPPGSFLMGPRGTTLSHLVTIGQPLAVGRYEVTFAEWYACVAEGGCNDYKPGDEKLGRGNRPVVNVSWHDAQNYVSWLSQKTGKPYRLLSEAEWEYAARAGTTTSYYWGDDDRKNKVICAYANTGSYYDCSERPTTVPVGSLRPNNFGLYDMSGNVLEWTADCWNRTYAGAPSDGRVWQQGDCQMRVMRGGSWYDYFRSGGLRPTYPFRSAARHYTWSSWRKNFIGFRVVRTMAVAPDAYREQHPYREQRPPREQREQREIEPKKPSRERPKYRTP